MRKQTKIAALVSAAALLAIGASMTSFAARGSWVIDPETSLWTYKDKDGEVLEGWQRWPDGTYGYVDGETGVIKMRELVEDGNYLCYVNGSGVRVTNEWAAIENEDGEMTDDGEVPDYFYYYFDKNGHAVTGLQKDIYINNEKKTKGAFYFGEDNRMLTGWVGDGAYYCEPNEDGASDEYGSYVYGQIPKKQWRLLDIPDEMWDDEDARKVVDADDDGMCYYYFDGNAKKVTGIQKIGNYYYSFDNDGILIVSAWVNADTGERLSTSDNYAAGTKAAYATTTGAFENAGGWHDADKDGKNLYYMSSWLNSDKQRIGVAVGRTAGALIGEKDKNGKVQNDNQYTIRVVNQKAYVFNALGQVVEDSSVAVDTNNITPYTPSNASEKAKDNLVPGATYYFDAKGAMVTKKEVLLDDDADDKNDYKYGYVDSTGKLVKTDAIINGVLYLYDADVRAAVRYNDASSDLTYEEVDITAYPDGKDGKAVVYSYNSKGVASMLDVSGYEVTKVLVNTKTGKLVTSTKTYEGVKYVVENQGDAKSKLLTGYIPQDDSNNTYPEKDKVSYKKQ